jgi:pimeloyl-ACP methyl ester carboxylesterase
VAQDLPLARSVRIPHLGHLAHEENPDIFDALFEEMVTSTGT